MQTESHSDGSLDAVRPESCRITGNSELIAPGIQFNIQHAWFVRLPDMSLLVRTSPVSVNGDIPSWCRLGKMAGAHKGCQAPSSD